MKVPRKALYILATLLLLIGGGIWIAKKQLLKTHPENAPAITQKETSPLDLRPAAIAKLQQLVEAGSDSLYQMRIDSLTTEIATGTIILIGVAVKPDTAVIERMRRQQRLPDDIFEVALQSLRITGISLSDLVNRRDISLQALVCNGPQIRVQHRRQPYNADERAAAKGKTLFSRLQGQLDRLAIDSISITGGNFTDESSGTTNTYKDVSVLLQNILVNAEAERDRTRFLFAKKMLLQTGKITLPAGKSEYSMSFGGLAVSGENQQLRITDFTMKPTGGKAEFLRHQKKQVEVYDIRIPTLVLKGIDWWAAVHGESLLAAEAELTGAQFDIYLDQRLSGTGKVKRDNFPQQMLMQMKMPLSLKKVKVRGTTLVYEEFTEASSRQSSLSFNNINAVAEGFTNLPAEVSAHPTATFKGNCQFMNASPLLANIALELPRERKGAFSADMTLGSLMPETINPFAEGMGLLRIKSGQLQYAKVHSEGNNNRAQGSLTAAYTDLHIMPLKTADDKEEPLRKKRVIGKLANVLLVKNNNPAKGGTLRQSDFSLERTTQPNFFNFLWSGIRQGMLKTIGLPADLGG